jgi:hypothetical protein
VPQAPLVISIDILDADAVSSLEQAVATSYEEREKKISEWLTNVIGYDPKLEQMESYARSFIAIGCHSVEMIIDHCNADDVDGFSWMLSMHKKVFLLYANLKQERSKETMTTMTLSTVPVQRSQRRNTHLYP